MKTIAATFAMHSRHRVGFCTRLRTTRWSRRLREQGGHVVRDAKGNIVEVSLARTWATDADVERLAGIKTLKKLDLSLTYVSDVGAESDWRSSLSSKS